MTSDLHKETHHPLPSYFLSNFRSIRYHNFDDLCLYINCLPQKPDFILGCETWLTYRDNTNSFSITNYGAPIRYDRPHSRGGGCAIWIRENIHYIIPDLTNFNIPHNLDILWIITPSFKIIIACIYISGSQLAANNYSEIDNYLTTCIDYLHNSYTEYYITLAGDFNSYFINHNLHDLTMRHDLQDINTTPTRGEACLDKFLISKSISFNYQKPVVSDRIGNSDHNCVLVSPSTINPNTISYHKVFDFRESNIQSFCEFISNTNFTPMYRMKNLEEKITFFDNVLNNALKRIPFETIKLGIKDKPWISPQLKSLINKRWKAYHNRNWQLYTHYKAKSKQEIARSKRNWVTKACNNARDMWKVTSSIAGRNKSSSLHRIVTEFYSEYEAASEINRIFTSVFSASDPDSLRRISSEIGDDDWLPLADTSWTYKTLSQLHVNKATGSDGINLRLYKSACFELSEPVTHLINSCIALRQVPIKWKSADVCAIPKSTPPKINELRPISLLPLPAKLLEKAILQHNKSTLFSLIDKTQYAYKSKSSTTCALIDMHNHITETLDQAKHKKVALLSCDMSKAFDCISHVKLIEKLLDIHNINPTLEKGFVKFLCSYLSDRQQQVRINNTKSSSSKVTSGVPQGSSLGPILFNLFMSDLTAFHDNPEVKIFKYADDVIFTIPLKSDANDSVTSIQNVFNSMKEFCTSQDLRLNERKTKLIIISLRQDPELNNFITSHLTFVQVVNQLCHLGLTFTSNLSWDTHIKNITARASKNLYCLRILKQCNMPKDKLQIVYNSIIRQLLEYACQVFATSLTIREKAKLKNIQSRAHAIICDFNCRCMSFSDLEERRMDLCKSLFEKCLNSDHSLHHLIPTYQPSGRLAMPICRTQLRLNSFLPSSVIRFNNNFTRI